VRRGLRDPCEPYTPGAGKLDHACAVKPRKNPPERKFEAERLGVDRLLQVVLNGDW
jgi:hypothetical protein